MTPANPHLSMKAEHGVAGVTFTRPDKGNAYDRAMLRTLAELLTRAGEDASVRMLVLRGEGRHFCAGAEIGADERDGGASGPTIAEVCHQLDGLPKPTLALVHGACVGGGMALAACCDVVIAERGAFFALPEVRLGFSPDPLIPIVLGALGARQTRRLIVSGERFGAEEALRIGLVHHLCEPGEAEAALARAVGEIMQAAPRAAARAKAMTRRLKDAAVTPELIAELQDGFRSAQSSEEAQEGRAAFREKRKPRWSAGE